MKSFRTSRATLLPSGGLLAALLLAAYSCGDSAIEPAPGDPTPPGATVPTPSTPPSPTTPPAPTPPPPGVTPTSPATPPPVETPPTVTPPTNPPGGGNPNPPMPPPSPPPMPPPPVVTEPPPCTDAIAKLNGLRAVTVARATRPIHLVGHPSDPETALIVERGGTVRVAKGLRTATTPVQLSAPILRVAVAQQSERGLLSLAIHPDDPTKLYAFYNRMGNNNSVVQEFTRDLETGMATPGKILYDAQHSAGNHQGGNVAFGPDKMLYFAIGDNGGIPDAGRARALDPNSSFGKVFRINPLTGMAPPGNMRGLQWALGLRNPFRMSFDRKTGDLYIGDVGDQIEEVNFVRANQASGTNFGWSGGGQGEGAPVVRYARQQDFAVIGGYVYRGTKNGCMVGRYFFADRARGPARSIVMQNGSLVNGSETTHRGLSNNGIYSFGEDGAGELYMLYGDGNAQTAGSVRRIVE
jgi:hypothetical protein